MSIGDQRTDGNVPGDKYKGTTSRVPQKKKSVIYNWALLLIT
jgi:hypothetical protein